MIGYFQTFDDLREWATARLVQLESEYQVSGCLVTLGYVTAMRDIVQSAMGPDVSVPAHQRPAGRSATQLLPFPVSIDSRVAA